MKTEEVLFILQRLDDLEAELFSRTNQLGELRERIHKMARVESRYGTDGRLKP